MKAKPPQPNTHPSSRPSSLPSSLPNHMRIAALQCNFEGGQAQTLRVPARWKDLGFNVEQLLHTHAELYSAVFDKRRHGPLLRRYLTESRRNGLETILYLNCHILLESQEKRIADWAMVTRTGEYSKLYGTYYGCCLNSTWTDYFLDSIESLAPFDIAGIFFDGPNSEPCYCPRCRRRFKAGRRKAMARATSAEASEFALECMLEFMGRVYARVKAVNPAWLAYFNMPVLHSNMTPAQIQRALACNDIVGTEGGFQFYGPPRNVDIWRCGLSARACEALAGNKPRVIFMAGDHKPWSWYMHTGAETRLCYASALANGASVWYGIHCSTPHLDGAAGRAARDMIHFDRRHDALYQHTESVADVALFYSFNTAKHYASSGEQTDFYKSAGAQKTAVIGNYSEAFNGAAGLLYRLGLPYDVVTELNLDTLERYRAIVLPTAACLDATTADALRDFVRSGGVLISDSESSLYSETGERRKDFRLSDVFGASFRGHKKYANHDYFGLDASWNILAGEGVRLLPAPLGVVDIKPARGSRVLARLCPPLAGRYSGSPGRPVFPFVVRNAVGKGISYFLAGTFFELYRKYGIVHYAQLIQHIIRTCSRPAVQVRGLSEAVEVTVRRPGQSNSLLVHLVNYTGGMTRPIRVVTPLHDIELRTAQPISRARALVSGRRLTVSGDHIVRLPVLNAFEVISLE